MNAALAALAFGLACIGLVALIVLVHLVVALSDHMARRD